MFMYNQLEFEIKSIIIKNDWNHLIKKVSIQEDDIIDSIDMEIKIGSKTKRVKVSKEELQRHMDPLILYEYLLESVVKEWEREQMDKIQVEIAPPRPRPLTRLEIVLNS